MFWQGSIACRQAPTKGAGTAYVGACLQAMGIRWQAGAGLLVAKLADNLGKVDGVEHFGLAAEVAVD